MVNIGTLEGRLTLESRQFLTSLRQAQGRANRTAGRINRNFQGLNNSVKAVAASIATLFTFRATANLLDLGQQVAGVTASFETFATTVGFDAENALQALNIATQNTIPNLELMRATNNALQLGVFQSVEQFSDLAEAAVILGTAVGRDASDSLNDLTTGLGRQSIQILDNLGITLRASEAYNEFAERVGKATSELTDQEKRLAFVTIGSERAVSSARQLAEGQSTLGRAVQQVRKAFADFRDIVGEVLAQDPGIQSTLTGITDRLGAITREDIRGALETIKNDLTDIANLKFDNLSTFGKSVAAIAGVGTVAATSSLLRNVTLIAQAFAGIGTSLVIITGRLTIFRDIIRFIAVQVSRLSGAFLSLLGITNPIGGFFARIVPLVVNVNKAAFALVGIFLILGRLVLGFLKGISDAAGISERLRETFRGLLEFISRLDLALVFEAAREAGDVLNRTIQIAIGSVNLLGKQFEALGELAVIGFLRARGAAQDFLGFDEQAEETAQRLQRARGELSTTFGEIVELERELIGLITTAGPLTEPVEKTAQAVRDIQKEIEFIGTTTQEFSNMTTGQLLAVSNSLDTTASRFNKFSSEAAGASGQLSLFNRTLIGIVESLARSSSNAEKNIERINELKQRFKEGKIDVDEFRKELDRLKQELQRTGESATVAGGRFDDLSSGADQATVGLNNLQRSLRETQQELRQTEAAAATTGGAVSGGITGGRQVGLSTRGSGDLGVFGSFSSERRTVNLGPVVRDPNDPRSIQASILQLQDQRRAIFERLGLGSAFGFPKIQADIFDRQIAKLQTDLQVARQNELQAIINGIIQGVRGQGLTTEAVLQQVDQELEVRRRLGLLPTGTNTTAGFRAVQAARF